MEDGNQGEKEVEDFRFNQNPSDLQMLVNRTVTFMNESF